MAKRKTKEEFIEQAKIIHDCKYNYSKVEYTNNRTKVCIICPTHGEFWQTPDNHLQGKGCPSCRNKDFSRKKMTTDEFIKRARKIHGDIYSYSKVEYINSETKVCIICPTHGEFWMTPTSHLKGCKCQKCNKNYKLDKESFIEKAKAIHGDKYDYSKVEYRGTHEKVCIVCPTHGEFWQAPSDHLQGKGCQKCAFKKRVKKSTTEQFIERAREVHGDKYDYSKVNYTKAKCKVEIICKEHGLFSQVANYHLSGNGCPKCGNVYRPTTEDFIRNSIKVHGGKYDYSRVVYNGNKESVEIICKEHGSFIQSPNSHLKGKGCPICKSSHLETQIRNLFNENNIEFIEQAKFKWLGNQSLDFYLPKYNVAIECQGRQHFQIVDIFGGEKAYLENIERDERKRVLCEKNGINLLYYSNLTIEYPYMVFTDKTKLLKEINNNNFEN